jgi:PPOX class probable F420-dependent enzyme
VLDPTTQAFVERQRVARLATVDQDGSPHLVPVVFCFIGSRCYTAVDEKPKRTTRLQRLRNIERNPQVAFLFDVYDEDWSRLAWVMLRGRAAVVVGTERQAALEGLSAKYPQYARVGISGPVIGFSPERVSRWEPS